MGSRWSAAKHDNGPADMWTGEWTMGGQAGSVPLRLPKGLRENKINGSLFDDQYIDDLCATLASAS